MLKYKIYLLTFPNGKKYCGYTSLELEKRWNKGEGYKKCPLVYKAIQKYGWESIQKEIIATYANQTYAYSKEKQVIRDLQLTNPLYGYNLDIGGKPHGATRISDAGRKKISEMHKKLWKKPEYRDNIIKKLKAVPHKKHTEETKKKISETKKGSIPSNIVTVAQYDKNTGEFIAFYPSASDAALALCYNKNGASNILAAAKGYRKTAYGYTWRIVK